MATRDLGRLYHRVQASTARLQQLKAMHAPEIIVRNEHRVLRHAVDELARGDAAAPRIGGIAELQLVLPTETPVTLAKAA